MALLDEVLPSGVRASKQGSPRYDASVAQLVEQRFRNPQVVGSTPTAGPSTNMFLLNKLLDFFHRSTLLLAFFSSFINGVSLEMSAPPLRLGVNTLDLPLIRLPHFSLISNVY